MKSELSSIEVGLLANEFKQLLGAKIDQIYKLKDKDVVLQLHLPNQGRKKVRVMVPKAIFLTDQSLDFPEKPPGFCLLLRKYLSGSRLSAVAQLKSERIMEFVFSKAESYKLVVELFSKGNIVLCSSDGTIIGAAERQVWSDRKIVPGSIYSFPTKKYSFYDAGHEALLGMFHSSDRDSVVKSLAMDLGLGGIYAEEACLLSSAVNAVPFRLRLYEGMECKLFSSFSSALDYYYSHEFKELSGFDRRVASLQHIISEQEEMLESMRRDVEESTAKAEAIYHNYAVVQDIIEELSKARKKYSWKEIREKLKGHAVVKEIDEAQGKVVVELAE
ncbi:NFACT family protein [Candidatus Woesearchaeota archaeon]|nr:NFACT family protein [Candidatus Woesearchaeota archaeon]